MSKSTNAEIEIRLNAIVGLLRRGASRSEILQYCAEKWKVSDRQADHYIYRAREIIKSDLDHDREYSFALIRSQLNLLYAKSVALNDFKTALAVLDKIANLLGMYPHRSATDVHLSVDVTTLTDEQLDALARGDLSALKRG